MGRLVKHGSQGVADAPTGGEAKDAFDLGTLPQAEAMELGPNTALYDKEAVGKNVLPEAKAAIEDVPTDAVWTGDKKGTIALQQDAGESEESIKDPDLERFANRGTPDYEGQKESQEDASTMVVGQKTLGHKTKSSL